MSFRIVAPLTPRQNANQDPNANPNQVPPPAAQQQRRRRPRPGEFFPQRPAN